jgi:hypothetical protein
LETIHKGKIFGKKFPGGGIFLFFVRFCTSDSQAT